MSHTELIEQQIEDLWTKDANIATAAFSPGYRMQTERSEDWTDPQFGQVADVFGQRRLREALENPDEETLEELAKKDPEIRERLACEKAERVALEFVKLTPKYVVSARNAEAMVARLSKVHLGVSHLDDDAAILSLTLAGFYTVENLKAAYEHLRRQGEIDVPEGDIKELSREERAEVVGHIRAGDLETAVVQFVTYANHGKPLPKFTSVAELYAKIPNTISRASAWVWRQSRVDVSPDDWQIFSQRLRNVPVLTIAVIDQLWKQYRRDKKNEASTPKAEQERIYTRDELEAMTADELARVHQQELRRAAGRL